MNLEILLKKAFDWYYEENIHHANISNDVAVELFVETETFKKFSQQANYAEQSALLNALNLIDEYLDTPGNGNSTLQNIVDKAIYSS